MANVRLAVNHVVNDKGETVISIGAPGSIERAKVQWPALIENLNRLYSSAYESYGKAVDEAYQMIRDAGVKGRMETDSILMASDYRNESNNGSVFSLTRGIDGLPPMQARNTIMTKKHASNWVKKNCVFAMNASLTAMAKRAAKQKGLDLDDVSATKLAAFAAASVMLKEARQITPDDIENSLKAALQEQGANATVKSLTDEVISTLLDIKATDDATGQINPETRKTLEFSNRPGLWRMVKPKAQELLSGMDVKDLARLSLDRPEQRVGPHVQDQRTRLTQPPLPQSKPQTWPGRPAWFGKA